MQTTSIPDLPPPSALFRTTRGDPASESLPETAAAKLATLRTQVTNALNRFHAGDREGALDAVRAAETLAAGVATVLNILAELDRAATRPGAAGHGPRAR